MARRGATATLPDWSAFLADYVATVDWPACAFWRELADENPDAIVLLSTPVECRRVVEERQRHDLPGLEPRGPSRARRLFGRAARDGEGHVREDVHPRTGTDETEAKRAYEEHNADGARRRRSRPGSVDWQPGDGWEPICAALSVPVPDDPFPHVNTTADFRAMIGLDG